MKTKILFTSLIAGLFVLVLSGCSGGGSTINGIECNTGQEYDAVSGLCLDIVTDTCGDYILGTTEGCDDGPAGSAGCSTSCQKFESNCTNENDDDGDGYIDCEDDDCVNDAACAVAAAECGNSFVEGSEGCDDGNTLDLDGCSSLCVNESLYLSSAVESYDDDGDGIANSIYKSTFDESGNQLSYSSDSSADGTYDRIYTYAYDSYGQKIQTLTDSDGDGSNEYQEDTTYNDSEGNQLTYKAYTIGSSGSTLSKNYVYTYSNNEIKKLTKDTNGDGVTDYVEDYVYDDAAGTEKKSVDKDGASDGSSAYDQIYTSYFTDGNLLTYEMDLDANGTADQKYVYVWNTDGTKKSETYYGNASIEPPSSTYRFEKYSYTYENAKVKTKSYDSGADGSIDTRHDYTYDSNGNMLTDYYYKGDGVTLKTKTTYTYDAKSNMLTYSYDSNADGTADKTEVKTYDNQGSLITDKSDSNGDGTYDSTKTYQNTYSLKSE